MSQDQICYYDGCNNPGTESFILERSCFGHEYGYYCPEHYNVMVTEANIPRTGYCERHRGEGEDIRQYQDPEEGSSGAYLDTCYNCRKKITDAFCEDAGDEWEDEDSWNW